MSTAIGLSESMRSLRGHALSDQVFGATRRLLLNVIATSIAARRSTAVQSILPRMSSGLSIVPGQSMRLHPHDAALVTSLAANVDDFDDTYLPTVLHPGAVALGSTLALASAMNVTGELFLEAFSIAVEAQIRLSIVLAQGDGLGWQNVGTCGGIGAAVGVAHMLRLTPEQTANAVVLAAAQVLGHRSAIGTLTKPLHFGKAAANGILSAMWAGRGVTAALDLLDGSAGFVAAITGSTNVDDVVDDALWHVGDVVVKPYPCGIVCHPIIDACLALSSVVNTEDIVALVVRCHPLVPQLTGEREPKTEFEAKVSTAHAAAAAIVEGQVGLAQFRAASIRRPDVARVRGSVVFHSDASLAPDECEVTAVLRSGETQSHYIAHARGSVSNPLSEAELEHKAAALIEPELPGRSSPIVRTLGDLRDQQSVVPLVRLLIPSE